MAELSSCRCAEYLHRRRAFDAQEQGGFTCSALQGFRSCRVQKLRYVNFLHLAEHQGYGTSFLRLAVPSSVLRCSYSLTLEACRAEDAIVRVDSLSNGNLFNSNGLGSSNDEMVCTFAQSPHDVLLSTTCQSNTSKEEMFNTCSGDTQAVNDVLHLHAPPARVRDSPENDASVNNGRLDPYPVRGSIESNAVIDRTLNNTDGVPALELDSLQKELASLQSVGREGLSDRRRVIRNSSLASPLDLVCALNIASNSGEILSSVAPFRVSDFYLILRNIEPSTKLADLFHWMKANCTTVDVHTMVFRELAKRREWTMLDTLLAEEIKICAKEAICEVFNKLFHVCGTEGAPTMASKWFRHMLQESIQPDMVSFRLLVPLFRKYEMLQDANFAYQHMHSLGVECSEVYSAMLKLCLCTCQFERAKQIFNRIWDTNQEPWMSLLTFQLNVFVRDEKVKKAEDIMNYMLESGESPEISLYNLMIKVTGKAGEYSQAREWFFCIEKHGLQPNEATYRSIIGACGRAGNLQDAFFFYDKMLSLGYSPSLVNYNTMIHLHRKIDNDGRILAILSQMKTASCCPNSFTMNSVLMVYERYGRLEKMPEALNLLREAGWEPSETCYGFLIRAYIRCNMVDEAIEVFDKMCAVAEPQEIMCHNLICMCKSVGRYDEALHVFHVISKSGKIKPCLRTSCAVIDVHNLKGAVEEGEALYEKVKSEQALDAATYNVILSMYLRNGLLEKAMGVLKEVLKQDLQPDLYLFLCMLKVCAKCGLQEEAVWIYKMIKRSNISWTPSLYTAVLHSCGRALPLEDILILFNAMMSAKIPMNNMTCNLVLDIFGKVGLLDKAEYVFKLAKKQAVQDGITYSTLIDAYGKNRKFNEMESLLMEMLNDGFTGCVEAYNAMLDAYGNSGQIRMMENTWERMRTAGGCTPNLTTFNTLMKVYGQEGLIKDVQIVVNRIKDAGLKLDRHSFTTLIHAYGQANMPDKALECFQQMQKEGYDPDFIAYSCLISVLRNAGYSQEAGRLSSWVKTEGVC